MSPRLSAAEDCDWGYIPTDMDATLHVHIIVIGAFRFRKYNQEASYCLAIVLLW